MNIELAHDAAGPSQFPGDGLPEVAVAGSRYLQPARGGQRRRSRRDATCAGERGDNIDYLANTVAHLDELGIPEGPLHVLLRDVEAARIAAGKGKT